MSQWEIDLGTTQAFTGPPPAAPSAGEAAPALTLLYHPEIERVGERALLEELLAGRPVGISRAALDFATPGSTRAAPLGDTHISRVPFWLIPLEGGAIRLSLEESRTAITCRGEAIHESRDFLPSEVARGVILEIAQRVVVLLHLTSTAPPVEGERFGLVGDSASMQRVRREIRCVADLDLPVLIRGETGTGKELVARAVHDASARRGGPFIAVNMGAIPPSLAASELFGAAQGAYTGAGKGQAGYFTMARGGTLFLDEIGEAPPEVQVLLLRALETGEIQGVGAQRAQKVDVRIIAATDADLEVKIDEGRFRAPLLHRLSSYEIAVSPLRERRDDIGRLLLHFLRQELERLGEAGRLGSTAPSGQRWLPASIVARLADLDWSGNIRQLRNVVRQLVVGSRGMDHVEIGPPIERLLREATPGVGRRSRRRRAARPGPPPRRRSRILRLPRGGGGPASRRRPAHVTEAEIRDVLRACRWDRKAAASQLGISRPSLYMLLENNPRFRTARDLTEEELVQSHRECGGDVERMVEKLEVSEAPLRRRLRQLGLE